MLFSSAQALSQKYEVGPFLGGANYIGDVGNSTYINPQTPVFGGLYKFNGSPRHSYRLSLLYANIEANDEDSNNSRRQQRGYSFSRNILEASAGLEFTFWEFDLNSFRNQGTPYLYTGLNYYFADRFTLGGTNRAVTKQMEFSVPLAAGYKQQLNSFLTGGIEIGARYAFTDNFDGSNDPSNENSYKFGNSNTNDWYVFTGIYLTFYFGRQPCYNNFE